jgi:hypothetical protein
MLNSVKALEVQPHWVRGIGQTPLSESIAGQQVAEFVVNGRLGNSQDWNQSRPENQHEQSHNRDREYFFS